MENIVGGARGKVICFGKGKLASQGSSGREKKRATLAEGKVHDVNWEAW